MDPQRPRLLIVDDDRSVLTLIGTIGTEEGFDVATTADGSEALAQLRQRPTDLVLLDLRMPGVAGFDVVRAIRAASPRCKVVLMSTCATIERAVEAVTRGAADYLAKPFAEERVRMLLKSIRAEADERRAVLSLERDLAQRLEFCGMVGRGPAMQAVFDLIRRLAPHARVALVTGEHGAGKALAAQALHQLGPRSSKPFLTVHCSAVVETLFESELFGHARDAFAGALSDKVGLFETADGGTIFLDEVGDVPLRLQAKLLHVLDAGEVRRMGALEPRSVDVRLIVASSRDLRGEVAAGRFHAELFRRLHSAEIAVPPLRSRTEDIAYLTASFVRGFAHRFNKPISGLTPAAEQVLANARWEGNVRQLRSVLERACTLADGEFITEADLAGILALHGTPPRSPRRQRPLRAFDVPLPLVDIERDHIVRTLDRVNGNKAVAARLLGVSRRAFYRQLERHGLHTRVPARSRRHSTGSTSLGQHA